MDDQHDFEGQKTDDSPLKSRLKAQYNGTIFGDFLFTGEGRYLFSLALFCIGYIVIFTLGIDFYSQGLPSGSSWAKYFNLLAFISACFSSAYFLGNRITMGIRLLLVTCFVFFLIVSRGSLT